MTGKTDTVQRFVAWLDHSGMEGLVIIFLEGIRPFGLLGAQVAYILSPFLDPIGVPMQELAQILEDPDVYKEFSRRIDPKVQKT
jgi:hypothetical protein